MGGEDNAILASALDLASRGFRVFPLHPGTKIPAIEAWPTLATTDEAVIRKVWNGRPFNIGVACGRGLLGLDVDMKNGKDGLASLKALGVELGGFVVRTPTGGYHGYYDGPDVSNSVGRLGFGLDIRSAGGFLVGPGSRVEAGTYVLESANDCVDVPAIIVQRLVARTERQGTDSLGIHIQPDETAAVERACRYLETSAPIAVEGEAGDHTTYQVAARLKDFGVSSEMTLELMVEHWNDRCSPPWDHEDLKTKVTNAYEYGTSPLGISSPSVDFAGVKHIPPTTETATSSSWFRHGDARGKVAWLYRNLLPLTGVVALTAPSQAGKTFLLIELARTLATGTPFFKTEAKHRGGTLFVFTGSEDSGFEVRLDALSEEGKLPISKTWVGKLSERGALDNLLASLQAEAAYILERHGIPVRMIVLETLAASGLLSDENSNTEASQAIANLAQISRAMNAVVVTSHHPTKEGNGSRGAGAITDNADYWLEITRHERAAVRHVELRKARNAEQRQLGSFTLVPVDLGLDEDGDPITSMSVSMGDPSSAPGRMPPHTELFLEAMQWAMDEAVDIGGRPGVEMTKARGVFSERKGGSKDKSNLAKIFNSCLAYTDAMGATETTVYMGLSYIVVREKVETDD